MSFFEEEDDDEDLIPGDNDTDTEQPVPPSDPTTVPNLSHIPASEGDIPIVLEPPKP